jgi:hypothetical protein
MTELYMNFIAQYGLFALETFTLVFAILLLVAGLLSLSRKSKDQLNNVMNSNNSSTKKF